MSNAGFALRRPRPAGEVGQEREDHDSLWLSCLWGCMLEAAWLMFWGERGKVKGRSMTFFISGSSVFSWSLFTWGKCMAISTPLLCYLWRQVKLDWLIKVSFATRVSNRHASKFEREYSNRSAICSSEENKGFPPKEFSSHGWTVSKTAQ